jgi:hypothetical protein
VTQLLLQAFDGYFVGTTAAKIWNVHVRYSFVYGWLYKKNFCLIWAIVWWFISFIYFALRPVEKINFGTIDIKKADLSSKD